MFGEILTKNPVAYITRDLERALGISPTSGFFIMTNATPFAKRLADTRPDIHLIESETLLDTDELLAHEYTKAFLNTKGIQRILVFKPTVAIERLAQEQGVAVLNPRAALAEQVEGKISQLTFLEELRDIFLPFSVTTLKEVHFEGTPFVLQFNHSHTGSGTKYIANKETLDELQTKFPERPVRTAPFISGSLFTNNNIVTSNGICVGNINYQITGLSPFTLNQFATIGNDWAFPSVFMSENQKQEYSSIANRVGQALQRRGWKGLFGIDVLCDSSTNKLWLLEINARQSASATFESTLQKKSGNGVTTMDAHLLSLLEKSVPWPLQKITTGAQITQKVTPAIGAKNQQTVSETLTKHGYTVTPYTNTENEQDWLRIQTIDHGLMEGHGLFNTRGLEIQHILSENI